MEKRVAYLDRNEYNYGPAPEIGEVLKNFDPNKLCFYTRIYDEGKKSILSDYISELYGIPEKQVIRGRGHSETSRSLLFSWRRKTENVTYPKILVVVLQIQRRRGKRENHLLSPVRGGEYLQV